jgi:5-formyltetrahydrofolate cyclo-ligase
MGETYAHEKSLVRHRLEAGRSVLPPAEVARLSAVACARVLGMPTFARARHVVVYAAMGNELDPSLIADRAVAEGKTVYHPRTNGEPPGFVATAGQDAMPLLSATFDRVLFVVPGVAFDRRGVRLGRGLGWYDRALAEHPRGVRIGLGYDFQIVADLPEAPWDIRMHAVVSEARVIGEPPPMSGQ